MTTHTRTSMRYTVTLGTGASKLWYVLDLHHDMIVGSWVSRTAAEADAQFRNRRLAALSGKTP